MFRVVDDSMRPTLGAGDGLLALRWGDPQRGQLRVFRDPRRSSRWLVKRVGEVFSSGHRTIFEARSDNPRAPGSADSHEFGWVSAKDSYRVVWTVRSRPRRGTEPGR
ncbi:S26 family signal peptidase [Micromonospora sp. WMMD736]|uniref:S26 family signal peptidase n=1 Tax=Micromonospora sp. WMMD736 TaxID=3404112 RepID=UPI003B957919